MAQDINTYWYNKLIDTLVIQTNGNNEKLMTLYLDKELNKMKLPYIIDSIGNILVVKNSETKTSGTYPCVVSHMDTVHSFVSDFAIYKDIDNNDILFAMSNNKRTGIGGDDKCGVFACLYLLKAIPKLKVVFFTREESGCIGSKNINKKFFDDCRYIIQLDRKGNSDIIQTYCGDKTVSHEFSSEIGNIKKKYGYKKATGTVTDVMKLWDRKVGISCLNLSCGYNQPHTIYETVSISSLWNSIKFTEEIIQTLKPKKYVSIPPKRVQTVVATVGSYSYNNNIKKQCDVCKVWTKQALLYRNGNNLLCFTCQKEIFDAQKKLERQSKQENSVDDYNSEDTKIWKYYNPISAIKGEKCDNCKKDSGMVFLYKVGESNFCYTCAEKYLKTLISAGKTPPLLNSKKNKTKEEENDRLSHNCNICGKKLEKGVPFIYKQELGEFICNACELKYKSSITSAIIKHNKRTLNLPNDKKSKADACTLCNKTIWEGTNDWVESDGFPYCIDCWDGIKKYYEPDSCVICHKELSGASCTTVKIWCTELNGFLCEKCNKKHRKHR